MLPPYALVSTLVEFAMVSAAKRDREFVAYFAPEGSLLSEFKMMCIRRATTAGEAGLSVHEL